MGPVRFSPMKTPGGQHTRASLDRTFESHASSPNKQSNSPNKPAEPTRQTPLSHEAETSATARRLGEPPTQHNPRAERLISMHSVGATVRVQRNVATAKDWPSRSHSASLVS